MQTLLYFHCIVSSSPLQKQFARNGVNQAVGSDMYTKSTQRARKVHGNGKWDRNKIFFPDVTRHAMWTEGFTV